MLVPAIPRPSPPAGCGGGRRRDEGAGTLMRAAYLEHGRGIGARRPLGVAAH